MNHIDKDINTCFITKLHSTNILTEASKYKFAKEDVRNSESYQTTNKFLSPKSFKLLEIDPLVT